jgi:hypothetical protein
MKYCVIFATVSLGLLVPLGARAGDDKIDKKVVDIVNQCSALYKSAKAMHAEGAIATTVDNNGQKREFNVAAVFDVERPNHLSVKTKLDGDAKKGPDVIADGKHLTVYRKALKQYVEEDSPDGLGDIGMRLLQVGPGQVGMLFPHVMADDPADLLMQGVNSCSHAGKDKVDDTPVNRLKFSQDGFDWEMWVAAEGKPYILRMIRIQDGENGKVTTTETYRNWKFDAPPAKEAFTFSVPADAKKVDEFEQRQPN